MEFLQTVNVQAYNDAEIGRKVREIKRIAAEPIDEDGDDEEEEPPPPTESLPYFDIGEATGKAGKVVRLPVEGGCHFEQSGFEIGGGVGKLDVARSGYGLFEAVGVTLGPFLRGYLEAEDAIHDEPNHQHDHFWSVFQFVKRGVAPSNPLPEEWWRFAMGFFSIDQKRNIPPTWIPEGTEILTLHVKILDGTAPGEYEVTCKNEWYYTNAKIRRKKFEFVGGGDRKIRKIETFPGKITVIE